MTPWRQAGVVLGIAVGVVGSWTVLAPAQPVTARATAGPGAAGGPHYTVVESQGHNLLVTDNATNKFYFYTVDRDKPVGSPLKLRASVDLNQIGKPEITVTEHAVQRDKN